MLTQKLCSFGIACFCFHPRFCLWLAPSQINCLLARQKQVFVYIIKTIFGLFKIAGYCRFTPIARNFETTCLQQEVRPKNLFFYME